MFPWSPCFCSQELSNIGDVTVSFDTFTPSRIEGANVTVARDASYAMISSRRDLRNYLSPGVTIRVGGADASADNSLVGTNGEGYLDYPGGLGHRYVVHLLSDVWALSTYPSSSKVC